MGLDGVELVMAFEERFGIEIKDEEAEQLRTPAMVIDLVAAKLNVQKGEFCATQQSFYHLRRAAMNTFGVPKKQIRPDTRLKELLPIESRIDRWTKLGASVDAISWPRLEHPLGTGGTIVLGSLLLSVIAVWNISAVHTPWLALITAGLLWVGLVYVGFYAAQPLRRHFPPRLNTFGDLSNRIILKTPCVTEAQSDSREQIRVAVRLIISEQLGIENTFDDNDSFVDDLGLN